MSKLTLASRVARALAVLACVLAQWWPVATYAGWSPPAEVQYDICRPLRGPGTATVQRYDCAP